MSHPFSPVAPGSDRCWCGSPNLARAHFPGSAGAESLEGRCEPAREVCPTAEEFEAAGEPGILVQRWTKPEALQPHRMVEDSLGEWLHWKDHIAALAAVEGQRDGLLAEVERLRLALHDTEHSLRQEEHLHRETKQEVARLQLEADVRERGREAEAAQLDALAAEVEHLRERLLVVNEAAEAAERGAERVRAQRDELAGLLETTDAKAYEDRKQRDALADALSRLRSFLGVFLCRDAAGQWRAALDIEPGTPISGEAITKAEEALRKAGRL